ncbi:MAG: DUF3883 domain-containing protein, partial [Planctomycetes bacterium]|nr:DUF3883 domain-containing protein [Planctomycetota bacterium]
NKSTSSTTNKSRSNKRYSNNAKYIGDCAEKQVLTYLKTAAGHSEFDVAENLRWVAQEGEKPGYDIEYTNSAGDLIGVEVKGSISKNFSNFELTANEWSAAKQFGDRYALVLVANVDKSPRFECFWNPAADSSFSAEPSSYTVKRLS